MPIEGDLAQRDLKVSLKVRMNLRFKEELKEIMNNYSQVKNSCRPISSPNSSRICLANQSYRA